MRSQCSDFRRNDRLVKDSVDVLCTDEFFPSSRLSDILTSSDQDGGENKAITSWYLSVLKDIIINLVLAIYFYRTVNDHVRAYTTSAEQRKRRKIWLPHPCFVLFVSKPLSSRRR